MTDRRRIEERIRRKEQEIQALEDQVREARIYIHALSDVLKMFPKDRSGGQASAIRAGSMVAIARDAIRAAGRPMHIDELLVALGKERTRANKTALGGSLSAYVRRGEVFTRARPNTFGLIQLSDDRQPADEPPANFGEDAPAETLDDDLLAF